MGLESKNNIATATSSDVLAKTGHGVLKAVYTSPNDRAWVIRDGTGVGGTAIMTITSGAAGNGGYSAPYLNRPFKTGLFIDNTTAGTVGEIHVVFE